MICVKTKPRTALSKIASAWEEWKLLMAEKDRIGALLDAGKDCVTMEADYDHASAAVWECSNRIMAQPITPRSKPAS